jgi:hypothetical protein
MHWQKRQACAGSLQIVHSLSGGQRPRTPNSISLFIVEPIREVLESDESDVIHCWALDSLESARCGSQNTALRRTAVAFVHAEWSIVAPMIPPGRHGGRRRSVNVREVLNGIFYVP